MPFTSHDDVINAVCNNNKLQRLQINKLLPSTSVAGVPHTFWKATGIPAAGSDPTLGLGGATTCSSSTIGAIPFTNATSPATMHLLSYILLSNLAGTFYIVDRLAHARVAINQTTGSFSPVIDGTARLDSGEGGMIIMEVTTALSAASNTFNLTYTNQAGTTGRNTADIATVASAVVGRVPYANFMWVPLQAGDRGVRQITGWTLVSGTATGEVNIVLVRPLEAISVTANGIASEKDCVVELPSLPRIRDNACICLYFVPAGASQAIAIGEMRIAEN